MKFKEIWKVNLKSFSENPSTSYKNQFILMVDKEAEQWMQASDKSKTFNDYSIDLTGDLFYNTEFYISEVLEKYPVNSLSDVLSFCTKNDIYPNSINKYRIDRGLFVGGEKDDLLTNDLELLTEYYSNMEKYL